LYDYTQRFPDRAAFAFNDGLAAAVRRLAALEAGYERVVLPAEVPAIHDLYLYYARYDPRRLHEQGLDDAAPPGAWADVRGFGRHRICRPRECCAAGDLCLVRGSWSGPGRTLEVIRDRTGRIAFSIVAGPTPPTPLPQGKGERRLMLVVPELLVAPTPLPQGKGERRVAKPSPPSLEGGGLGG
jgi:hypothetical protein